MKAVRIVFVTLGILVGIFLLMQAIPYGRTHSNPPVVQEPKWDSPRTRELAVRACFDCHSNETKWPWYANVAPSSWLVQLDVEAGRSVLNFSEMHRTYPLASYSGRRTRSGMMPPKQYMAAHPEAELTAEEIHALAVGLDRTLGTPDEQARN